MNQKDLSQDYLKRYVLTSLTSHLKSETDNLPEVHLTAAAQNEARAVWRPAELISDCLQIGETLMSKFFYEGCQLDISILLSDYFDKMANTQSFSSGTGPACLTRLFHLLKLHITCLAWACSAPAIPSHQVKKLEKLEARVMNYVNTLRLNQDLHSSTRDWIDKDDFAPYIKILLEKYTSQGLINTIKRIVQETDAAFVEKALAHHLHMQRSAQNKNREAESNRECFKNLTNLQAEEQQTLAQRNTKVFRGFDDRAQSSNANAASLSSVNQNELKDSYQMEVVHDKRERLIMELKEKCEKENKTRKNLKIIELKSAKTQFDRTVDETKSRDQLSATHQHKYISQPKRGMLKVSFNTQVSQKRAKHTINSKPHLPFDKLKQQLGMHNHLFDYTEMDECDDRSPSPPAQHEPQTKSHPPLQQQQSVSPKPKPKRKDSDARSHFIMDFDAWGQDIVAKSTPIRGKASKTSTPKKTPPFKS